VGVVRGQNIPKWEKMYCPLVLLLKKKGKVFPLQVWCGPEGG